MKYLRRIGHLLFFIVICIVGIHMSGYEAFAAEDAAGGWRPKYDIVMKWINFGILAFVIVKYLKKPLMDFLNGQKADLAKEIDELESEKKTFLADLRETQKAVDESDAKIEKIKERITRQGKREKERIINDAKQQSVLMIEESKKKAEHNLVQAKDNFKSELIDSAVTLAMKQLPNVITEEDSEELLEKYLTATEK